MVLNRLAQICVRFLLAGEPWFLTTSHRPGGCTELHELTFSGHCFKSVKVGVTGPLDT